MELSMHADFFCHTYCFGFKVFLCVIPPNNNDDISKHVSLSYFVALSKGDNSAVLGDFFWMTHHCDVVNNHLISKKSEKDNSDS